LRALLGADVNRRGMFGGPGHGEGVTALHLAAQNNALDVISALLAAAAAPRIEDGLFHAGAAGWAEFAGRPDATQLTTA
jgi:Ankyrin repeat